MSEVAGRMASQVGAQYLEAPMGGRGILLGGVPGVSPANVVIIGGGVVGHHAAKIAVGLGAHVTIIDRNLERLRELDDIYSSQIVTLASNEYTIRESLRLADLVIGAVLIPGASAPRLVRRDMLSSMKKGAVMVDVAIDQGGCFETSRATTHTDPIYFRGRRSALLRIEHAGRGSAYVDVRAEQRHVPVPDGARQSRPGGRLRAQPGDSRGSEHVSGARGLSRRSRSRRGSLGKSLARWSDVVQPLAKYKDAARSSSALVMIGPRPS